ncbi:hypothetical protein P7H50_14135 [Enterococcus durans]|uniref:hypothetical protein n=1 Tax=Enterococcus durans TaxID=53345 RepID=UPI002891ECCF|nr:hypothetical protein [Enterococcus durans]MDT2837991.1 hypothetical protein [Enterococcus durans]
MKNLKEKFMNASLKTRLFVTGAVASVVTAGPAVFADEVATRQVREVSSDALVTTLNEIKAGVSSSVGEGLPLIFSIAGIVVVAFASFKIAKRFFSKAV